MAHIGQLVAAVTLCWLAVTAQSQGLAVGTPTEICQEYIGDGSSLSKDQVIILIEEKLANAVQNMNDELFEELFDSADDDSDEQLNQSECEKLVAYLNKDRN